MSTSNLDLLIKYFTLSEQQQQQYAQLPALYAEWNEKINVISRKDIGNIVCNHILHSLAIGRFHLFKRGTRIFDIGTGGGFPGIPLAILFPECHFTLIDSIGKKVRVATAVADAVGLTNVTCLHTRAEEVKEKCDFIVSRAALSAADLVALGRRLVDTQHQRNALPNGVIALKGGDLQAELRPFRRIANEESLGAYFSEEYFATKKIVHIPL